LDQSEAAVPPGGTESFLYQSDRTGNRAVVNAPCGPKQGKLHQPGLTRLLAIMPINGVVVGTQPSKKKTQLKTWRPGQPVANRVVPIHSIQIQGAAGTPIQPGFGRPVQFFFRRV